jgi:FAD-dependent urate hydroxylase
VLIGADGLHSVIRDVVGAPAAKPTGWCSWQGLVTLPRIAQPRVARMIIGEHGNLGLWPAGGNDLQWWFDLPWTPTFSRPQHPIQTIRHRFTGWLDLADEVLATLTDADLASSPFPHYRHPIPAAGAGPITLLGDAAHTMPPTLAQGTNQALLDTMVLRRVLADATDTSAALRRYESTRRRRVKAVSWVTTQQVSRSEAALRPVSLVPDRVVTWALARFIGWTSHRGIAPEIRAAPIEVR